MSSRRNVDRSGYIGGYPKHIDGRLVLTDFNGKVLGHGRIVNKSKIRPGAPGHWLSSERVSYQFVVDGKRYHGRGYGDQMSVTLRPMKGRG
jgi:hypothetical protein